MESPCDPSAARAVGDHEDIESDMQLSILKTLRASSVEKGGDVIKQKRRPEVTPATKLLRKMETMFSCKNKIIPSAHLMDGKCFQGELFGNYKDISIKDVNNMLKIFSAREWPKDVHLLCGDETVGGIEINGGGDYTGLPWIENNNQIPPSLANAENWFDILIYAREEKSGVALIRQLRVKRMFQDLEILRLSRVKRKRDEIAEE